MIERIRAWVGNRRDPKAQNLISQYHIAALALPVWYSMIPPSGNSGRSEPEISTVQLDRDLDL